MLKRIFAAFMVYSLLFTSGFASTNDLRTKSLNTIFERMNYQLAVLWDQKDVNAYNKIIANFESAIEVERKNGLTSLELLKFIKTKIVKRADKEDFQTVIDQFDGNMTEEDAQALIADYKKTIKATGTNWLGMGKKKMAWIGLCIVIFIGAGVGIYYAVKDDDDEDEQENEENENQQPV